VLVSKINFQIRDIASKDDMRGVLQGIHVTPWYTEATDGNVFARVIRPELDEGEFPNVEGEGESEFEAVIPVKGLPREAPKSSLPILSNFLLRRNRDRDGRKRIEVITTDLERVEKIGFWEMDGVFPDINRVIPGDREGDRQIIFNPQILTKLLNVFVKSGCGSIKMTIPEDVLSAVKVEGKTEEGKQSIMGMVMPMKVR